MNLKQIAANWGLIAPEASRGLTMRLLAGLPVDIDGQVTDDPYATVWLDPFEQRIVVSDGDTNVTHRATFNPECLEVVRSLEGLRASMGAATIEDAERLRDMLVADGLMVWRHASGWMLAMDDDEWVDYAMAAVR